MIEVTYICDYCSNKTEGQFQHSAEASMWKPQWWDSWGGVQACPVCVDKGKKKDAESKPTS